MYAIEFKATIRNGMIPIPKQYVRTLQSRFTVIVLQEAPVEEKNTLKRQTFLARVARQRFDLPQDYCFTREELYDRI